MNGLFFSDVLFCVFVFLFVKGTLKIDPPKHPEIDLPQEEIDDAIKKALEIRQQRDALKLKALEKHQKGKVDA